MAVYPKIRLCRRSHQCLSGTLWNGYLFFVRLLKDVFNPLEGETNHFQILRLLRVSRLRKRLGPLRRIHYIFRIGGEHGLQTTKPRPKKTLQEEQQNITKEQK